jgi:hypothetical protein
VAVVHLGDLDVPIVPEPRRRLAHQMGEEVDAKRHVGRLQHRDGRRGGVDRGLFGRAEASGPDHQRPARGPGRFQHRRQRGGRGEIDQHVAARGDRGQVVAPAGLGGQARAGSGCQLGRDRLAHPPPAPTIPMPINMLLRLPACRSVAKSRARCNRDGCGTVSAKRALGRQSFWLQ